MDDEPANIVSLDTIFRFYEMFVQTFYSNEIARSGLRAAQMHELSNSAINRLMLEKHNCEVIKTYAVVAKLHKISDCSEAGFGSLDWEKNGGRIGVFPGATKNEWAKKTEVICDKYKIFLKKSDLSVEYVDA